MRVLVADDHDLVRDMVVMFLSSQNDLEVTGVSNYQQVVNKIDSEGPIDLLLLDYRMPGMDGLRGLHDALKHKRAGRVALMSGDASRSVVDEAIAAGAAGFLPKTISPKSLRNAVAFMLMGETYLPAEMFRPEPEETGPRGSGLDSLGKRERTVLRMLCAGASNKEIARDLGLTEAAVKLHLKTVYRHLGVSNRTQAALRARDEGLA
jgi:two-component system nitrate/nitrite response regulator NarL